MAYEANLDIKLYRDPDPALVARIVRDYGSDAAETRWHWMSGRRLAQIAAVGRAQAGRPNPGRASARTFEDSVYAVATEAAFALGSGRAGERGAGLPDNILINHLAQRGLAGPVVCADLRGLYSLETKRARAGDAAAAARIESRHAHERAVAGVLRVALAMVPDQPSTGRYRLPEPTDELAAALAGHDPAAIATVFPGLVEAPVTPAIEEPAPMTTAPVKTATAPAPRVRGRAPEPDQIRLDHAQTTSIPELASRWGISESGAYQALRRVGLTGHRGFMATPARAPEAPAAHVPEPETNVVAIRREAVELPAAPPPPSRVVIQARAPEPVRTGGRLGLDDLALAYRLACECGIPPEEALAFVRADVAAEAGRAGVYA